MYASYHGHVEVVDTLLQRGAKVDLKKNVRNYISLHAHHIQLVLRILTLNSYYIDTLRIAVQL